MERYIFDQVIHEGITTHFAIIIDIQNPNKVNIASYIDYDLRSIMPKGIRQIKNAYGHYDNAEIGYTGDLSIIDKEIENFRNDASEAIKNLIDSDKLGKSINAHLQNLGFK